MTVRVEIVVYNYQHVITAETDEILGRWLRELIEAGKVEPNTFHQIRVAKYE